MSAQPVIRIRKHTALGGCLKTRYYWFVLVASNGERLMCSETYTRKASRDKAVRLLLRGRMEEA